VEDKCFNLIKEVILVEVKKIVVISLFLLSLISVFGVVTANSPIDVGGNQIILGNGNIPIDVGGNSWGSSAVLNNDVPIDVGGN